LPDGVIAVRLVALDLPDAAVIRLEAMLSGDEHARAGRFRHPADRRRFVVRRARLRQLLGAVVDRPPEEVMLATDARGKPHLAEEPAVQFSCSHSGELAALAVATRPVGIDVERFAEDTDIAGVAASFTARERAAIGAARERFFACWTCKEAYAKATGYGLATPLDAYDVSGALDGAPSAVDDGGAHGAPVVVQILPAPPDHALALATVAGAPRSATGE
jgi:4'-phosphopantetheinyl transferase